MNRPACENLKGVMFPTPSGSKEPFTRGEQKAKTVCWSCGLRRECLTKPIGPGKFRGLFEEYGVWGGLAEKERRVAQAKYGKYSLDDIVTELLGHPPLAEIIPLPKDM